MSKLTLDLQLLSPTVIAQRPTSPGQITRSPDYLSGTVLRGGIAGLWRERYGTQDEGHFQAIFVQGQLRFGNAWPQQLNGRTWIVPQSAATEKRGGWFADGDEGVSDLLTQLLREAEPDDMEPVGDTFVCEDTWKGRWEPLTARRRLISRTAIERAPAAGITRGVAADGQLYSFEALETGQCLRATISGPDHLITVLAKLLVEEHSLGERCAEGFGQVRLLHPFHDYREAEEERRW